MHNDLGQTKKAQAASTLLNSENLNRDKNEHEKTSLNLKDPYQAEQKGIRLRG